MDSAPATVTATRFIDYQRTPDQYVHWKMNFSGAVATLSMDVNEDHGILPGYKLKLNSYDLGVDIELHDALQRIRFEHPEVRVVVLTSAKQRMFCAGANIYMLGLSSHAWKVNFCKFTNETRNGMEDSSRHSGLKFIAALNGNTAGGGYEIALACDEIILIDDRSSAVSLPEVPLLGVLPGTGGLTRLIDKRKVRRDLADMFCTTTEGVRAERALQWKLVDSIAKPQQFASSVAARAAEFAMLSDRPENVSGIALRPLVRHIDERGYHYKYVDVIFDRARRCATITLSGPLAPPPATPDEVHAQGCNGWPLQLARELDDAILLLRTNELDLGIWILKTRGDAQLTLAYDALLNQNRSHWLVRETIGMLRRTLARLEVSSRSLFAIVDQHSNFTGTLAELLFAVDRSFMLHLPERAQQAPRIVLSAMNFGGYETVDDQTRLSVRFYGDARILRELGSKIGTALDADAARGLGLVTLTPDDIDWDDEIRLAVEERASLSPDALSGLEANLRFAPQETMISRMFGRLSAWQNWIFNRPNAVGAQGALKVFGTGAKPGFDRQRI